jgi:hypothetical protein
MENNANSQPIAFFRGFGPQARSFPSKGSIGPVPNRDRRVAKSLHASAKRG